MLETGQLPNYMLVSYMVLNRIRIDNDDVCIGSYVPGTGIYVAVIER